MNGAKNALSTNKKKGVYTMQSVIKSEGTPKRSRRKPAVEPDFVKPSRFAKMFDMSLSAVHRAIDRGDIVARILPLSVERDQRRIPMSEVERFRAGTSADSKQEAGN